MKILEKLRKLGKRGKVAICTAFASINTLAVAACASATAPDEGTSNVLEKAGTELTSSFSSLVSTMIPVILGILGSALVIFGIFALVKLAKKIFGKVAG